MTELLDLAQCEDFFGHCPVHSTAPPRESQLNFFDLSTHTACCALCVAAQPLDTYIQVRRSSYHDVVKVQDISRFADISGVQGYTINSSKVIFLRRRPQPRPPKGAVGASLCTVCSRHLQDVSLFCSLQCKLDAAAGVKHVSLRALATGGAHTSGHTHSSGSSGGGAPGTPSHLAQSLRVADVVFHPASDSDGMAEFHGPPAKRRKGCPHRAPSE